MTSFDTSAWVGVTPSDTLKTSGEPSQPCQQIIILRISSYTRSWISNKSPVSGNEQFLLTRGTLLVASLFYSRLPLLKDLFMLYKQALWKFSETAKGWFWNMEKLYRKYAVKLYPMILVVNQYMLLESSFEIMLSELKMIGKWQTFWLLLIHLKQSTEQKGHFIKLWYLKWKGVDRDRTLHLLGLNWTADFSWYSWSNTVLWLVS